MDEIDPAFVATSHAIGDLPLCQVRLQDDARLKLFFMGGPGEHEKVAAWLESWGTRRERKPPG